jgi:hypothetical protein
MRRLRRYVIVLAASALIISLAMILPAGAQTTSSDVEYYDYELVICDTDSDGDIEKIQLLNWIALDGDGTVDVEVEKAFEETTSWQGVHGWTAPSDEGDLLLWEGLSTSDFANFPAMTEFSDSMREDGAMRIPLDLRYQYFLDGRPVDPNDITGESGRFRMELTLENTSEEMTVVEYEDPETGEMIETEIETYLPMVIIPYDWYFDNTTFFNLECDPTGLVFWMPDFYQVGWSIPLFPPATEDSHTIWVEADVKNFHLPTLTLPVAFVFPETNQIDTTALFKNGLEQIFNGVKQLDEGLVQAEEGVGDPGTADTLLYGIAAINDGLAEMGGAVPEAQSAINNDMIPGVQQMYAGTDQLLSGNQQIAAGLQGIAAGIGSETTDQTLLYAMAGIESGLDFTLAAIGSPGTADTLLFGAASVTQGLNDTLAGLQQASGGLGGRGIANTIIWGLDQISQNCDPTNPLGLYAAVFGVSSLMKPLGGGLYDYVSGIPVADPQWLGPPGFYLANIQGQMNAYTPNLDAAAGGIQFIYNNLEAPYPNGIIPSLEFIKAGLDQAIAGIGSPTTPDTMLYGMAAITGGLQAIAAGIGSATTPDTLLYAVDLVQLGLNSMLAGIGGPTIPDTLLNGTVQMQYGLEQIKGGLSSGDPNNPAILEGLVILSAGLTQVTQGIGSPGTPDTLLYGGAQIEGGLTELGTGLGDATGGTALMLESLMDNLVMLNVTEAELEAIHMRGEEFDHFLGRAEGAEDNQVRFVYQTKPAYDYVEGNSWLTALILSIVIGLLLLIGGILLIRAFA